MQHGTGITGVKHFRQLYKSNCRPYLIVDLPLVQKYGNFVASTSPHKQNTLPTVAHVLGLKQFTVLLQLQTTPHFTSTLTLTHPSPLPTHVTTDHVSAAIYRTENTLQFSAVTYCTHLGTVPP
jgi:hypothetical protein